MADAGGTSGGDPGHPPAAPAAPAAWDRLQVGFEYLWMETQQLALLPAPVFGHPHSKKALS